MGKKKRKSSKSKSQKDGSSGTNTTEEASNIHKALFKYSDRELQWESLLYQEHSLGKLEEMLITKPHEFKRCKLKMERPDLAYAKPLDDLTCTICIRGTENVGRSFSGDEVCVQILSHELQPFSPGESLNGRVVGLMQRTEECCTMICRMEGAKKLAVPVKNNMITICILQKEPDKIEICNFNPQKEHWVIERYEDISEDQLVVVRVLKWERIYEYPLGVVIKVLSHKEYFNEFLKLECDIRGTPPSFKPRLDQVDCERADFLKDLTFTIDSEKAQDLDDAFSLADKGEQYMLAIHITDVASYIRKGSKEDTFAKQQSKTFYPPPGVQANPSFMFSRDASSEYLSLFPKKNRKAISLVIMINKSTNMIESSYFTLSKIMSDKQLSYETADKIIQDRRLDDNEAPLNFSTVEDCVAVAYYFTKVLRRFRLEGSWSIGQRKGDSRAHCMVEELMILYNNAVAEELISKDLTKEHTPLRCHVKPYSGLFDQFKKRYSALLPLSPYLSQICKDVATETNETKESFIHVFTPVFQQMKALAQKRDYHKLVHLIISDEIHPTLCQMANEFKHIQNKSVILRSCSNLNSKLGHYDLQLNAYTWASSPMRRYIDLVLQRLLHNVLLNKHPLFMDYTKTEIDQLCDKCDSTAEFDFESLQFMNETKSISRHVTKLAVVDKLAKKDHDFFISVPLDRLSGLMIKYSNLNVVEQPDFDKHGDSCTLTWKRRVYSFSETIKPQPQAVINKNITPISFKNWTKIISALKDEDWVKVRMCLQDVSEEENERKAIPMSKACTNEKEHFTEWKMTLKLGEVLQVQLGTEVINGATMPVVNLLTVSSLFEVCLEHARNPIKCFTSIDHTCHKSKTEYGDYKDYQEIWGKLCEMNTAFHALEENNSVIFEDVVIIWKETSCVSLSEGYFTVTQTLKKNCSLEFDLTNSYLCIRLRDQRAEKKEETEATQSSGSALSDLQDTLPFTWVAHGVPIKAQTHGMKKQANLKSSIQIDFQINQQNMTTVPAEVLNKKTRFTVEVIPKKIPYMLSEQAIDSIKHANDLVKSIATGKDLTVYSDDYMNYFDDYMNDTLDLQPLNESQERAVKAALRNPFTVIQGPPGTGKTVVGVHIAYHFYKKNTVLEAECPNQPPSLGQAASSKENVTKKRAILYCGPSNKAVDIVAEQVLKLKGVLKPLRIYSEQMEMREYPYPGSELKLSNKSIRDEKPKEALRDISLMYLVRQPENPYAEELNKFEDDTVDFDIERYKDILRKARKHELLKHDIIFCTCSTAQKPILKETMDFQQILIDECAMATEPEAFIPLVSHKPQQIVLLGDHQQVQPIVTCDRVKDLGMKKSLFERYMVQALMLDTQYRMHESICEFPSNEFYGGKLKTGTKPRICRLLDKNNSPTAILFGHVEGEEINLVVSTTTGNENSAANKEEAKQAIRVAKLLISQARVKPEDIAILTPYNAQISEIKNMLVDETNKDVQNISVCTITKSQGSEWCFVIISTVRSCTLSEIENEVFKCEGWLKKKLGFITDPNQVNVAITRAQDGLCILGNRHLLNCCNLWGKLLAHYQEQNCLLDSAEDIKVSHC